MPLQFNIFYYFEEFIVTLMLEVFFLFQAFFPTNFRVSFSAALARILLLLLRLPSSLSISLLLYFIAFLITFIAYFFRNHDFDKISLSISSYISVNVYMYSSFQVAFLPCFTMLLGMCLRTKVIQVSVRADS